MWLDRLRDELRTHTPPALCVAFSGGTDYTALLHGLAQLPEARQRGLRALHVDHRLHPDSAEWATHCMRFCESIAVPLDVLRVTVDHARGEGTEAAARHARHAALAGRLQQGEWLALAHHRDDQVETVLLKLLRGAGPEGLGGMRARRAFGPGFLWRPLLETTREELRNYLIANALHALQDPTNRDPHFTRNLLRHEILPRIAQHCPHAQASILHSAALCRAASEYLARDAERALALLRREDNSLDADGWRALPDALRAPVLDLWLRQLGLPTPADAQRRELERQSTDAAEDSVPRITWHGAEVRIWDDRLHAMTPLPPPPADWEAPWDGAPLDLPEGCGTLRVQRPDGADPHQPFDPPLTVRLRRGGEHIKPAGDAHTRALRDLFQQARVPPWQRMRIPLVCERDQLVAVADLWTSARGDALITARGFRLHWERPAQAT